MINLTVYSPLGIVVYAEQDVKLSGKLQKTLDLSNLAKGVYLLKAERNGILSTISIVIDK